MKVSELIEKLKLCPQDLDVFAYYDGDARTWIDFGFICERKRWNLDSRKVLVLAEKSDVYNLADDSEILFYEKAKDDESDTTL